MEKTSVQKLAGVLKVLVTVTFVCNLLALPLVPGLVGLRRVADMTHELPGDVLYLLGLCFALWGRQEPDDRGGVLFPHLRRRAGAGGVAHLVLPLPGLPLLLQRPVRASVFYGRAAVYGHVRAVPAGF